MRAETILGLSVRSGLWNETVTIHPEQARALLENQPQQRPITQSKIDSYAQLIRDGRFVRTHQGMAFDENGNLADGQNRLWACFLTSTPITVVCFFNELRENFEFYDRGKVRNAADDAVIAGLAPDRETAKYLDGAARILCAYDDGQNPTIPNKINWSVARQREVVARHPMLSVCIQDYRNKRRMLMPTVPLIAFATLMREADNAKALIFMHQFLTGENIEKGDPAYTLRESLRLRAITRRSFRIESSYRFVRAWNAFYAGRSLSIVFGSVTPMSDRSKVNRMDVFPRIAGLKAPGA